MVQLSALGSLHASGPYSMHMARSSYMFLCRDSWLARVHWYLLPCTGWDSNLMRMPKMRNRVRRGRCFAKVLAISDVVPVGQK